MGRQLALRPQFSPKGSLVYSIKPEHTLRFTYNEAFQVATYPELFLAVQLMEDWDTSALAAECPDSGLEDLTPVLGLGNEDLELEEIATLEVGYSGVLWGKAFLTVDWYKSRNENFFTDFVPQVGSPLGQVNKKFGPWEPLPGPMFPPSAQTTSATRRRRFSSLGHAINEPRRLDDHPRRLRGQFRRSGDPGSRSRPELLLQEGLETGVQLLMVRFRSQGRPA